MASAVSSDVRYNELLSEMSEKHGGSMMQEKWHEKHGWMNIRVERVSTIHRILLGAPQGGGDGK